MIIDRDPSDLAGFEPDATRRNFVGASEAAALIPDYSLLGEGERPVRCLSPYAGPLAVWEAKVGLRLPTAPSMPMRIGLALEPVIIDRLQLLIDEPFTVYADITQPPFLRGHVGAHPDLVMSSGFPGDVKVVTNTGPGWGSAWNPSVPRHYHVQLAAQAAALGIDDDCEGLLASLHLDRRLELRVVRVPIRRVEIEMVVRHVELFWRRHVITGIPPRSLYTCGEHESPVYPLPNCQHRVATLHERALVSELRGVRATLAALKREEARLADELKNSIADTERVNLPSGEPIATFKPSTRATINPARVKALSREIADAATITVETRTLRLKGDDEE
jgi:hypothetical protein